jgi:hypothetical protein
MKRKARDAEAQSLTLRTENKMVIERMAVAERAAERLRADLNAVIKVCGR